MLKVVARLKDAGEFEKFSDAFKKLYAEIDAMQAEGYSIGVIERTTWIQANRKPEDIEKNSDICVMMMDIFQARAFAEAIGLLKDGKINNSCREPAPGLAYLILRAASLYNQILNEAAINDYAGRSLIFRGKELSIISHLNAGRNNQMKFADTMKASFETLLERVRTGNLN